MQISDRLSDAVIVQGLGAGQNNGDLSWALQNWAGLSLGNAIDFVEIFVSNQMILKSPVLFLWADRLNLRFVMFSVFFVFPLFLVLQNLS